jgi:hypothetical protein
MNDPRTVIARAIDWALTPERNAERILVALAAAGYAVVPVYPTKAMLNAGHIAERNKQRDMGSAYPTEHPAVGGGPLGYAYRAMVAAAKEGAR